MFDVIKGVLGIPLNLIIFYLFGALVLRRKGKVVNEGLNLIVGFFTYYILFFIVIFPFMIKYRPLSWFMTVWIPLCVIILVISAVINRKNIAELVSKGILFARENKAVSIVILAVIFIQILIVTCTYNFTLDAAYYVANVTTTIDTNMINVYDPFTGAWLDHYEVRYLFATYPINDAVMCKILAIPALVQTKLTMSGVIIIIVNILYIMIARCLFREKDTNRSTAIMLVMIFIVNITFYTIFTSSLFLLTRTYEGKTIVGNLSILAIFYIFMMMISDEEISFPWLSIFIISVGSMTISSSGNMLIPAELSLLFVPYMFVKKTLKPLVKYIACMIPGIAMLLVYVLYIEGYFVFYTYPR
ncbi:MAG: DUF6077 domain-containing protein [Lachnospiraceae bacterium]|nr:DUF6077 domain-containing protein [Lachnospiraceae bacterium]